MTRKIEELKAPHEDEGVEPLVKEHQEQPEISTGEAPKFDVEKREKEARSAEAKEVEQLREDVEKMMGEGEEKIEPGKEKKQQALMGDFQGFQLAETGQIKLSAEQEKDAGKQIEAHKRKFSLSLPSIARGSLTDTEYESQARNFSTRTKILELEGGQKVFAVYNYPLSGIHRTLDGIAKRLAGDKMSKASSKDWKKTFESRSNVPIIECDDPRVVLMPYLPNVNAHDLFANNHKIKDFGECPWAENITPEEKLQLGEQIIREVEDIHRTGRCWGETILPNIIVTAEKKVVVVDPETQYDKDVPKNEQKARDLRDIIVSICGALRSSEAQNISSYRPITERLMAQYSDKNVIEELKKLVSQKPTFIQKMLGGSYESARLGISAQEYKKVTAAILESGDQTIANQPDKAA